MADKVKVIKKATKLAGNNVVAPKITVTSNSDYNAIEDLNNSLNDYFQLGTVNGTSHLSKMILNDLKLIEKNSSKDSLQALSALKDILSIASKTQDYFDKKKEADIDFSTYMVRKQLFDWQKEVVDCGRKKISMLCGRRSGKTFVDCAKMIIHCLAGYDNIKTPEGLVVKKPRQAIFIGLTLGRAAAIIWQPLKELIEKCRIPVNKIDNSSYVITFANGASIMLSGNATKAEREKLRGLDFSMAIIDEVQSQQGMNYLMDSIINPILSGRDGELILSGTAPLVAGGYWSQVQKDATFYHIHATMQDNPTIPNYSEALQKVLEDNRWTEDNIIFKREYLGLEVYDTNRLVIPLRSYFTLSDISNRQFNAAIIAVDPGYADNSAFCLLVRDKLSDKWFIVNEYVSNGLSSDEIVAKVFEFRDNVAKAQYKISDKDIYVTMDTSHLNILQTIYNRGFYNTAQPVKSGESQQWADLNEACASGKISTIKDSEFDKACNNLSWKVNEETNTIIYEIDDKLNHELRVSDIADAVKYGYQLTYQI